MKLLAPTTALAPGDRAPNFALPDHKGRMTMFYEQVSGRPTVLVLVPPVQPPARPPVLAAFEQAAGQIEAAGIDLFCILRAPPEAVTAMAPGVWVWADPEGRITTALAQQLGLAPGDPADGAVIAALDGNQRLISAFAGGAAAVADLLALYAARPAPPQPQVRKATAPVLILPDVLDADACAALIHWFRAGNPVEGTTTGSGPGGKVTRVNHDRKRRLDLDVTDQAMTRTLVQTIGRRIAPELEKAFGFQGFGFDTFKVCRYASDRADHFRAHRDNLVPGTENRRFAITLNLNGDDYEGGELIFPEYGPDRYKSHNGGAVVFSCSLMHEVVPVTAGERFALLTFLRTPQRPAGQTPAGARATSRPGPVR